MAYTNFKFVDLEKQFGLRQAQQRLFSNDIALVPPSDWLLVSLEISKTMPLRNEKPKSEYVIAPILAEVKQRKAHKIQLFSGENLEGDKKSKA